MKTVYSILSQIVNLIPPNTTDCKCPRRLGAAEPRGAFVIAVGETKRKCAVLNAGC